MHTGVPDIPFKLTGILQGLPHYGVGILQLVLELRDILVTVAEGGFQLLAVDLRHMPGNHLGQAVALGNRQPLDTGDILQGRLGGHGAVGDDMGYLLRPVLVGDIFQHTRTPVIVEVDVDIREGDTVGVEESLKQEVIFDGVYLGDSKAIGHARTGGGTTAGTHRHAELGAGLVDEVLHDKEVAGEAHRLHDMKLELDAFLQLGGERGAVTAFRPLVCEFGQVVGLEFYAVELVVASEFLYLFLPLLAGHDLVAVLVAGELVEKVLLRDAGAVFLLCAELLGDGEERHDWSMVDVVELHLVENLAGVLKRLGEIGEYLSHLLGGLEPLLFGVEHTVLVGDFLVGGHADKAFVGLRVILVDEVDVIGGHNLYPVFVGDAQQLGVDRILEMESLVVGAGHGGLMALKLKVIVFSEHLLVPLHLLFGLLDFPLGYKARNLATQTGRTANQPLGVGAKLLLVCTGMEIESLGPGTGDNLDKVVVAFEVLGQQYQVAAFVTLVATVEQRTFGHIHLAAEYRLEYLLLKSGGLVTFGGGGSLVTGLFGLLGGFQGILDCPFGLAVLLGDVVIEFLDAEHVAVVGKGYARHTVGHSLVYQRVD